MNSSDLRSSPFIRQTVRGRGAHDNPANRFDEIVIEADQEYDDSQDPSLKTTVFEDHSKSIITFNNSPDISFQASLNPYRGCEHGCVYCYARPGHEYFGLSSGLDFESKIFAKRNASQLLEKELKKKSWQPQPLVVSGVTDPYQPIEKQLEITRSCLAVLQAFRNPVAIISKSHLVTRDVDILSTMSSTKLATVYISVTTLDASLSRVMEPRACVPQRRLDAIRQLTESGIPVGVMIAPVIPGLTDEEIPSLISACVKAGAQSAGYVVLRLPYAVKDLFVIWLERYFPDRKNKILNRIRELRGGKLYDADFKNRMKGQGIFAEQIKQIFQAGCRRSGLKPVRSRLDVTQFKIPAGPQMELFESL